MLKLHHHQLMRFLLIFAALACHAQTLKTLVIAGTAGTFASIGSDLLNYSYESRTDTLAASRTLVSNSDGTGGVVITTNGSSVISVTVSSEGDPDGNVTFSGTAGVDYRFRYTHNGTALTKTLEVWLGDCTGFTTITKAISAVQSLGMNQTWTFGPNIRPAFARLYSTLRNGLPCPVDAPSSAADQFDFIFENGSGGTLVARAGGYTMSAAGSSFADSTLYPPLAVITGWTTYKPSFRAMTGQVFSGATSVGFGYPGDGTVVSYFWTQLSGPAQSTFSSRTSATPSITPPLAGQYVYRLTVADSTGTSASATQTIGTAATDSNGVVVLANAELRWALGDILRHGVGPWSWLDTTEAADVDILAPYMNTPPVSVAGPGTCTIPSGAPNQLISGLITGLTYGNVAIECPGANFTGADVGTNFVINWDPDGDASNSGRFVGFVNQVIDADTIVLPNFFLLEPAAAFANPMTWGRLGATYQPYNAANGASQILTFYEAGLAVGREWLRTGLTTYQTQFHNFCDNSWRWSLGSGYTTPTPRNSSLNLMIACGADTTYTAPVNLWAGIERLSKSMADAAGAGYNPTVDVVQGTFDPRENSYALRAFTSIAKLGGAHGLSTVTNCGYLANQIAHVWIAGSAQPVGFPANTYSFIPENLFSFNLGYPSVAIGGVYGTSPWRSNGLPLIAITMAYDALADASTCNNSALAAQLFTPGGTGTGLIPRMANYIYSFGRDPDGGLLYNAGFKNTAYDEDPSSMDYNCCGTTSLALHLFGHGVSVANGSPSVTGDTSAIFTHLFWAGGPILLGGGSYTVLSIADNNHLTLTTNYSGTTLSNSTNYGNPSTVALVSGSPNVVGTNTHFTTQFAAPYNMFCAAYSDPTYTNRGCAEVTAITDDTHMTLGINWPAASNASVGTYMINRAAESNCGPLTLSTTCDRDKFGARNLSADVVASAQWLYVKTANATWKAVGDYYANKLFGGSSSGAGAAANPPTGTAVYSPGAASFTNASTAVTGVGTSFLAQFSPCNGTTSVTVADGSSGATFDTYARTGVPFAPAYISRLVASCADDTHLTLSTNYAGTGATLTGMFYNAADPNWQGADGGVGNLGEILPVCGSAPCGSGAIVKYGKPLGMASGAGNVPVALADRLGGVAPVATQALLIAGAFPAGGDKMRCTITTPDGAVTVTTSSSGVSKCSVSPDTRMVGALIRIAYLKASDAVIANGDPYRYLF